MIRLTALIDEVRRNGYNVTFLIWQGVASGKV